MEEIQLYPHSHYLFKAKWILPITLPPIFNGGIEVKGRKIVRIGKFKDIKRECKRAKLVDFEDSIILPALVNAHTHLELSALRFRLSPSGSFGFWVKNIIKKKAELSPFEMKESARMALNEMWKDGIGIIGEVSNSAITLDSVCSSPFFGYYFQEIIDFKGLKKLSPLSTPPECSGFKVTYSAHAPYTVSPLLLQAIKSYTRKRKKLFVIHCAESEEEVEFLKTGKGFFKKLLQEKGQWNESFSPPGKSPVMYLYSLGILDKNTLLIHAVHLNNEDIKILKKTNTKVCVCLRSNLFIGVGKPPLKELIENGIEACVGTDSLASNDKLSIWEELKALSSFYPEISLEKLLEMATFRGANILGFKNLGALSPGFLAFFIVINLKNSLPENFSEVITLLVNSQKEVIYRTNVYKYREQT